MKLKNFLYLAQLEEYDVSRIKNWLAKNPNREVLEIKKKLVWTTKAKFLNIFAKTLFFLKPEKSIIFGLQLLQPLDKILKEVVVFLTRLKFSLLYRNLKTIAITGSWGKTTAKESLTAIISTKYETSSTEGNKNTLLGICKAVFSFPTKIEVFVCEVGAYYQGDISKVCSLIKPNIGIITAIGSMHLERFGSMNNILKAKMELAQAIPPDGRLYLPRELVSQVAKFNLKVRDIVYFDQIDEVYQDLGHFLKIEKTSVDKVLANFRPIEHRQQIIKNGTISIIDDTYNSNPVGFEMALKKLLDTPSQNRILITPGMIELGQMQEAENIRLAKKAGEICQQVIVVGQTNRQAFIEGLRGTPAQVHLVDNISEAQKLLPSISSLDATILFENDLPDNYF